MNMRYEYFKRFIILLLFELGWYYSILIDANPHIPSTFELYSMKFCIGYTIIFILLTSRKDFNKLKISILDLIIVSVLIIFIIKII